MPALRGLATGPKINVHARRGPAAGPPALSCYRGLVDEEEDRARADAVRLHVQWLGRVPYREAWGLQKELAARRADVAIGDWWDRSIP